MMNRTDEIWNILEQDNTFTNGVLIRKYSADIVPDIFVALKAQEKLRCLAFPVSNTTDVSSWNTLQDINFELIPSPLNSNQSLLNIVLTDPLHKDIFSILCEDLISAVQGLSNEQSVIKTLLSRFNKWNDLFTKTLKEGLSNEEQKGLFGELMFLRQILQSGFNPSFCLQSWTGQLKSARDFQYANWAVEIKTTTAVNPQKIIISNERQLDTRHIKNLFLVHYCLEAFNESGETLNDLVLSIKQLIGEREGEQQQFNFLLFEGGYLTYHENIYARTGYKLHQEKIYKIKEQFPRLTESNIPLGISELKYSISIATCEQFIVHENDLISFILENADTRNPGTL